jgi:hypothetical protein
MAGEGAGAGARLDGFRGDRERSDERCPARETERPRRRNLESLDHQRQRQGLQRKHSIKKALPLPWSRKTKPRAASGKPLLPRGIGRYAPRYREGEIVVVTKPGFLRHRDGEYVEPSRVHRIDQSLARKFILPFDKSQVQGIDATKQALKDRAQQRSSDWEAIRLGNATKKRGVARSIGKTVPAALDRGSLRSIGKLFDVFSSGFESLPTPIETPEQKQDAAQAKREREAEAADRIDVSRYLADREQERQRREDQERANAQRRERGGRDR